ncbi:VOC family protein [Blastococcus sp. SYSU DS0533]
MLHRPRSRTSAATPATVPAAGAALVRTRDEGVSRDVLADPEGNEFRVSAPERPCGRPARPPFRGSRAPAGAGEPASPGAGPRADAPETPPGAAPRCGTAPGGSCW